MLVSIWARIVSFDPSCQVRFCRGEAGEGFVDFTRESKMVEFEPRGGFGREKLQECPRVRRLGQDARRSLFSRPRNVGFVSLNLSPCVVSFAAPLRLFLPFLFFLLLSPFPLFFLFSLVLSLPCFPLAPYYPFVPFSLSLSPSCHPFSCLCLVPCTFLIPSVPVSDDNVPFSILMSILARCC